VAKLAKRAYKSLRILTRVERALGRSALIEIAEKVASSAVRTSSAGVRAPAMSGASGDSVSYVVRLLSGELGENVSEGLGKVLNNADDVSATMKAVERLGQHHVMEELLLQIDSEVAQVLKHADLAAVSADELACRMLMSLDDIAEAGGGAVRFAPETLRGMAIVRGFSMLRGWRANRISKLWRDFGELTKAFPQPETRIAAFEQFLGWIAEGQTKGIKGWERFLQKATGAGLPNGNTTKGYFATLDYLATEIKWQNVVELERGIGKSWKRPIGDRVITCYPRYVDVVVQETVGGVTREVFREIKNLRQGAEISKRFKAEVMVDIREAITLAGGRGADPKDVADQFLRRQYLFRGSPSETAQIMADLRQEIVKVLPGSLKHLAGNVGVWSLGGRLPI
jgi:hypothetical protein